MIDATQLPRVPTRVVPDESEPISTTPSQAVSHEQAKKMELKAGRYYAVSEEK